MSKYGLPAISADIIITPLAAEDKETAIKLLVDKLFAAQPPSLQGTDKQTIYEEVMRRERIQSTGIGNKLAFPHARVAEWGEVTIAIGVCPQGIDFTSPDNLPAHFICLIVSDTQEPYGILKVMSSMSRFFSDPLFHKTILEGNLSAEEISRAFTHTREQGKKFIIANDLIRPVRHKARLDMSVEEVTRTMHLQQTDTLAVVDEHDTLCGEISCLDIFQYGMPAFFYQLNTVSFVRHIDPFEKYFKIKGSLSVKDIYRTDVFSIDKTASLMEIIYAMTVGKQPQLYVVDEHKTLIGTIDRFCIIDKILFY